MYNILIQSANVQTSVQRIRNTQISSTLVRWTRKGWAPSVWGLSRCPRFRGLSRRQCIDQAETWRVSLAAVESSRDQTTTCVLQTTVHQYIGSHSPQTPHDAELNRTEKNKPSNLGKLNDIFQCYSHFNTSGDRLANGNVKASGV